MNINEIVTLVSGGAGALAMAVLGWALMIVGKLHTSTTVQALQTHIANLEEQVKLERQRGDRLEGAISAFADAARIYGNVAERSAGGR